MNELSTVRSIVISRETMRRWNLKLGQSVVCQSRRHLSATDGKGHLDEVALKILDVQH